MQWFLIFYISSCAGLGGDPGIVSGACVPIEHRVTMPSLDVCRSVRAVNQDSKCVAEEIDQPQVGACTNFCDCPGTKCDNLTVTPR